MISQSLMIFSTISNINATKKIIYNKREFNIKLAVFIVMGHKGHEKNVIYHVKILIYHVKTLTCHAVKMSNFNLSCQSFSLSCQTSPSTNISTTNLMYIKKYFFIPRQVVLSIALKRYLKLYKLFIELSPRQIDTIKVNVLPTLYDFSYKKMFITYMFVTLIVPLVTSGGFLKVFLAQF